MSVQANVPEGARLGVARDRRAESGRSETAVLVAFLVVQVVWVAAVACGVFWAVSAIHGHL